MADVASKLQHQGYDNMRPMSAYELHASRQSKPLQEGTRMRYSSSNRNKRGKTAGSRPRMAAQPTGGSRQLFGILEDLALGRRPPAASSTPAASSPPAATSHGPSTPADTPKSPPALSLRSPGTEQARNTALRVQSDVQIHIEPPVEPALRNVYAWYKTQGSETHGEGGQNEGALEPRGEPRGKILERMLTDLAAASGGQDEDSIREVECAVHEMVAADLAQELAEPQGHLWWRLWRWAIERTAAVEEKLIREHSRRPREEAVKQDEGDEEKQRQRIEDLEDLVMDKEDEVRGRGRITVQVMVMARIGVRIEARIGFRIGARLDDLVMDKENEANPSPHLTCNPNQNVNYNHSHHPSQLSITLSITTPGERNEEATAGATDPDRGRAGERRGVE